MREGVAAAGAPAVFQPDGVFCADSLARLLLAATSRALRGQDCADLTYQPLLSRFRGAPEGVRRAAVVRAAIRAALTPQQAAAVDAESVARWVVGHYPPRRYPAVLLGSPHGATAHLAAALGVPWLPAAFELAVRWPQGAAHDPAGARAYATPVVRALVAANPGTRVRQVHDPAGRGVLAGATISLLVRWHRLPAAYRRFLGACRAAGAPVVLLRDGRAWPVLDPASEHSFQLGGPDSGLSPDGLSTDADTLEAVLRGAGADPERWSPPPGVTWPAVPAQHAVEPGFEADLRRWAGQAGAPALRVVFARPEGLSAATADLYRQWLRAAGKTGDRCVVECGRLLDPWQVVRAGLVPYWCENATRASVTAAELWLAGSEPFSSVDVLPEPPGAPAPGIAGVPQWLAVASFGRRRGAVDRVAVRNYPVSSVATRRATEVLRGQPYDLPAPDPLTVGAALGGLAAAGRPHGLLVC